MDSAIPESAPDVQVKGSTLSTGAAVGQARAILELRLQRLTGLERDKIAEELTEVACWAQLHHHDKPMLLLNLKGYYDPLLAQLDRAVQEGFMSAGDAARLQVFAGVEPLMAALLAQLRWASAAPVFTTSGSGCGPA